MPIPETRRSDALLTARRFIDAVNERDLDALRAEITDDVELQPGDGEAYRGVDGARAFLQAAERERLRLIPLVRGEHAEDRDAGHVVVELHVRELRGDDDAKRIADLVVRDGDVESFVLRPATAGA